MAFNPLPQTWIPNWTSTTDNITGEVTNTYVQTFKLTVSAIDV